MVVKGNGKEGREWKSKRRQYYYHLRRTLQQQCQSRENLANGHGKAKLQAAKHPNTGDPSCSCAPSHFPFPIWMQLILSNKTMASVRCHRLSSEMARTCSFIFHESRPSVKAELATLKSAGISRQEENYWEGKLHLLRVTHVQRVSKPDSSFQVAGNSISKQSVCALTKSKWCILTSE